MNMRALFSNFSVGHRLILLVVSVLLVLSIIGTTALYGLNYASKTSAQLNDEVAKGVALNQLLSVVQNEFVYTTNNLHRGSIIWNDADLTFKNASQSFDQSWSAYLELLSNEEKKVIEQQFSNSISLLKSAFQEMINMGEEQSRGQLELFILNDLDYLVTPFTQLAQQQITAQRSISNQHFEGFSSTNRSILAFSSIVFTLGLIGLSLLGILTRQSITSPIQRVMNTVKEIGEGNFEARTQIKGNDEISELSNALDNMLDDRLKTLLDKQDENDRLNTSIINLLEATSQLSERDLTVTVPVSEDVTGPIADAMNLVAYETAQVLIQIKQVATNVESSANSVRQQGEKVTQVAENERLIVSQTIERLEAAAKTMAIITKLCQASNVVAEKTSKTTNDAFGAVQSTINEMNEIRETISETEKRIKRLGERSQEISGIVDIINNIAERTHVLALNASMHAAAAGEAGRGFAVVADEVQRLAESSRNATSQIAGLVNNIQMETAETMSTMNKTITQVVEGSNIAEKAGQQMQETQKNTEELVQSVAQIAERSLKQAKLNELLRQKANEIKHSTEETGKELQQQSSDTISLVESASALMNSVRVFRLPGDDSKVA